MSDKLEFTGDFYSNKLPSRYLEAHTDTDAPARRHRGLIFILDSIKCFYKISIVTNGRKYADVRRDMHFESGTGCHIQADSRLFVLRPERPVDARPEIHERRESLVQEEVVGTEEKWNGGELIIIEITVAHSKPDTKLLIDKPFMNILGCDTVAARLPETISDGEINNIQTSFSWVI